MKTKSILILVMVIGFTSHLFAQEKLFEKFFDKEGISQVTITKSLLEMMPDMKYEANIQGVDVGKLAQKLDQIDVFTAEEKNAVELIKKEVQDYFAKDKSFEVLMRIKEADENIVFYAHKEKELVKSLVMYIHENEDVVLIWLQGEFTMKDVQSIIDTH